MTLRFLQSELEAINAVRAPRVGRFLVGREESRAAYGAPLGPEALLVEERGGELRIGLWLDEGVRRALRRAGPDTGPSLLGHSRLAGLACAAEGVSHFVYLSTRAAADRPVSLLELEVQAEVDVFALLLLHLWRRGRRRLSPGLRRRLFQGIGWADRLDAEELARYRLANRLGAGYARWLEGRFVGPGDAEGLVRELRCTYRRGGGDKLAYLDARALA